MFNKKHIFVLITLCLIGSTFSQSGIITLGVNNFKKNEVSTSVNFLKFKTRIFSEEIPIPLYFHYSVFNSSISRNNENYI